MKRFPLTGQGGKGDFRRNPSISRELLLLREDLWRTKDPEEKAKIKEKILELENTEKEKNV